MGILTKLKSVLGMDGSGRPRGQSEPNVTVEREPSTESEQAVKGEGPSDAPRAPRSASAAGEGEGEDEPEANVEEAAKDVAEGEKRVPVEDIDGIGPTYAKRLEAAGISTIADLAESDVGEAAEAAETNESRVEDWIKQAKEW